MFRDTASSCWFVSCLPAWRPSVATNPVRQLTHDTHDTHDTQDTHDTHGTLKKHYGVET
jgi:hypothetical protein